MKKFLVGLLLLSAFAAASDDEIDRLIDDVLKASPETRYEKMNAFKTKMRELNAQQRSEALKALQAKAYPNLEASGITASPAAAQTPRPDRTPAAQQQMRTQQQQFQMQTGGQNGAGPENGRRPNRPVQTPAKPPVR